MRTEGTSTWADTLGGGSCHREAFAPVPTCAAVVQPMGHDSQSEGETAQ